MKAGFLDTYRSLDWLVVAAVSMLLVVGVLFIYSSGMTSEGEMVSGEYSRQVIWALTGLALLLGAAAVDPKRLPDYTLLLFLAVLAALVYTRLFGRVVNGARSWIGIGEVGLQPSEFMKLATVLFVARYLRDSRHGTGDLKRFVFSFGMVLLPMALILSQPDFGTALVFLPVYLFMAWIGGVQARYLVFLLATGAIMLAMVVLPLWNKNTGADISIFLRIFYERPYVYYSLGLSLASLSLAALGWRFFKKAYYYWIAYGSLILSAGLAGSLAGQALLKEYQVMRLMVFLDPTIDPLGSGWNILQSITAIGSGGFSGKGFLQGTQSHYRYLPQQSTDFIFSIVSEELGFVGGIAIFALYLFILVRLALSLRNLRDPFQACVVAGVFGMIFFHFMINVGMAMGIMPITGIPLLFMSYGGSSLWAVCLGLGLCLGIGARKYDS